jgi:hypothetical protein
MTAIDLVLGSALAAALSMIMYFVSNRIWDTLQAYAVQPAKIDFDLCQMAYKTLGYTA